MSRPKSARFTLRDLTAEQHDRVDALYAHLDLANPDDYPRLLRGLAGAFLPVEAALDAAGAEGVLADWPARRRAPLLLADLADLGAPEPAPLASPALPDEPSIWGAIYVLEGSRLGGEFLRRGLYPDAPARFLGAEQPQGAWRKMLDCMEESLYSSARLEGAAAAARAVFELFEQAGHRESGVASA